MRMLIAPLSIIVVLLLGVFLRSTCTQAFFSENILAEKYSDELSSFVVHHNNYYDFEVSGSFLPSDYNSFCPPGEKDGKQVNINFSIVVMNIEVNEIHEEVKLEMNFRVMWMDKRLANLTGDNEFLVLNPKLSIWFPDVFFDHVKSVPDPYLLSKPKSIRLHRDGSVRFSARTNLVISCHMNFHLYPAHILHCPIDVMSYAYPSNILALDWENNSSATLNDGLLIPNYKLQLIPTTFSKSSSSGIYSGIRMTIKLGNQFFLGFHMLQTYFPSSLFLILSWFTFLIPQNLGTLHRSFQVMLAAVMLFASVRQTTPRVSYVKAIDIWVVFSICFIFVITLHHAVTIKLRNIKGLEKTKKRDEPLCKRSKKLFVKEDSICDVEPNVLPLAYKSHEKNLSESRTTMETNLSSLPGSSRSINNGHHEIQITESIHSNKDQEDLTKKASERYRNIGNLLRSILRVSTPILLIVFSTIYWAWLFTASECF